MKTRPLVVILTIVVAAAAFLAAWRLTRPRGEATAPAPGPDAVQVASAIDIDFTRMSQTMQLAQAGRLAAAPGEFAGKTVRVSGTFVSAVDPADGKRYYGCMLGGMASCGCCAAGGVLEFAPKDPSRLTADFPPPQSVVTVTGRLEVVEVADADWPYSFPRLVDAEISVAPAAAAPRP